MEKMEKVIEREENNKALVKKKQRIEYFDIAKGIGIISVILGHLGETILSRIISTYHMPLFFIISGYFYKYAENKDFIRKKAKNLLLPYIVISLILFVLLTLKDLIECDFIQVGNIIGSRLLSVLYGSGYREEFLDHTIPMIGAIWFLLALFEAFVIINVTNKSKLQTVIVVLVGAIGYFSAKYIWLPLSIQAGMFATIFVYIGKIIKEKDIFGKIANKEKIFNIIMFAIWIVGIIFNVRISMVQAYCNYGILSILVSLVATYCIIVISKFIEKMTKLRFIKKILILIGENTLIILCLHIIELSVFPWEIFLPMLNSIWTMALAFLIMMSIKIVWITLGTVIIHKSKFLSKVFSV